MEGVLQFWFEEISPAMWWQKNASFDQEIIRRFSQLYEQARRGELYQWRHTARGRLAEIIVLDQFSRNMFRDKPEAFAQDSMALALAQEAIASGADQLLTAVERSFIYMPYMHSESLLIHQIAVELFRNNGIENNLQFELKHLHIIEKFGRYPHRNGILGRGSSAAEQAFLKQAGSSF